MATFIPGGLFGVSSIQSQSMTIRDQRLKEAKSHADRSQRELTRDRMNLERKEKHLMAECKRLAKKGDMHGARLVANQIARFRRIHDRNLEASVLIGTKAQSMVSDHKVNKAQVETVKGFSYANMYENFQRTEAREQRYGYRMNAINHLENSNREAMDGLFRNEEDVSLARMTNTTTGCGEEDPRQAQVIEYEIQSILHQAVHNGKHRVYVEPEVALQPRHGSFSAITGQEPPITFADTYQRQREKNESKNEVLLGPPHLLHFKLYDRPQIGSSLRLHSHMEDDSSPFVPALATIDSVKRKLIQDQFATSQLNLFDLKTGLLKPFLLGRLAKTTFLPFDFSETMISAGLPSGSTVYVRVLDQDHQESTGPSDPIILANGSMDGGQGVDEAIRERLNLLNAQ